MTQDSILSVDYKGHRIRIEQDTEPMSPREWDNLGTMVCFHRHYELGDKTDMTIEEAREIPQRKDVVWLPLYLLDHSGIWMNTGGFGHVDPQGWDSGQVGIIYVEHAKLMKEWSKDKVTLDMAQEAGRILEQEVKTYNEYLTGDVLGYIIEHDETCEHCHHTEVVHDDSCWGYYGMTPEGLVEEAKGIIDSYGLEERQLDSIIENHQI